MSDKKEKLQVTVLDEDKNLVLAGRFRPRFGEPLPHLNRPGAHAVAVSDVHGNDDEFFCLLCEPDVFIRRSTLMEVAERAPRRMRLPHAAATIRMKDGRHFFAIIFDQARARPLPQFYEGRRVPDKDMTGKILPSIVACLTDLAQRSIGHRAIRPENILVGPEGEVLLDQCVTGLPGEDQPLIYETIHTCLATAGGRGEGSSSDDYYALGVTALQLLTQADYGEGMSPEEIQTAKIQKGSYQFLLRRQKFSSALQSFFAGTLADSSRQRWDIEALRSWAGGHWDMPRPAPGSRRAARPFLFNGGDIYCQDQLAWAFHAEPEEALAAVLNHRAEKWLRNVLEDNQAADAMENARRVHEFAASVDKEDDDETVARAILALDPRGPMRFRSLTVTPSGVPGTLWSAFMRDDEETLADMEHLLSSTLMVDWLNTGTRRVRTALPTFVANAIKSIMIERNKPGFGLERVMYEMLTGAPCLELSVRQTIARTPGDLVLALDRLAQTDQKSCLEIGRHAAAFVMTRDKSAETTVRALSYTFPTESEALIARADLLAYLQRNYYPAPLINLTTAIGATLQPTIEVIKSRIRRMVVTKKIETQSQAGDISEMIRDLDLSQTLRQDVEEFKLSKVRLQAVDRLIAISSTNGSAQAILAQKRGYRYAKLFSSSVAFMTIFYFAMIELL